jgi:hypothetical protein
MTGRWGSGAGAGTVPRGPTTGSVVLLIEGIEKTGGLWT